MKPRIFAAFLAATVATACSSGAPSPDRILVNARIWTGDSSRPQASALAIRGDRIVAIGDDSVIRALAGEGTQVEDLGGRRVVPGLHDAHWHLPARRTADLAGATGPAEIISRLTAFAAELPADAWITGRGWAPDMFPGNTAHRRYLDEAFPDRAVLITDRDGHQALANSRALSLAGVGRETPEPDGGAIIRDADGSPTGLLQETAMSLVRRRLPAPTADEVYAAFKMEMHRAAAFGLTALQMAGSASAAESTAIERALADDSMLVRFRVAVPFDADAGDSALGAYQALARHWSGPLVTSGIAKGVLDGTIDAGTAAMLEPYARGGGRGLPRWEAGGLADAVARYDSAGLQVELHAIGDLAIRMALDAFGETAGRNGPRDRRHRVEHLEVPDSTDIPRFATLGVIASTQAIFAIPDKTTLQNYAPMLGPERASRALPFRALDEAGAVQAFGSDYPVFPMDPLQGIWTAVTRQLADGTPEGGWYPEHRISVEAALAHYTAGSAYSAFREGELGILREGMLADFVVLSEEIIGVEPQALLRAKPVLTVMGGRDTYRDASMPPSPAVRALSVPVDSAALEIRRRRESSNAAIARHDTAGIGAILAPDLVVVTSNSVHAMGRELNIRRFNEQFQTRPDVVYRRTPDSIAVFEPWLMAAERGRWTGSWTDTDGRLEIGGAYFAKWRKLGESWFVESETYVPEYCRGGAYCRTVPRSR